MSNEKVLLGHLLHHNLKDWLLRGCRAEEADTIRRAIERTSSERLCRGLAKVLARNER
jgi:hypothetical protein